MKHVFDFQESYYNLRSESSWVLAFRIENIKTTHYGIQFQGRNIWAMKAQNIINCKSLQEFKRNWLKYGNPKLALAE